METQFNQLSTKRRSIYNLGKNINIADKGLFSVIKQAVRNSPSAFNSQSVRTVVLLGNKSDKVWDITERPSKKLQKILKVSMRQKKNRQFPCRIWNHSFSHRYNYRA